MERILKLSGITMKGAVMMRTLMQGIKLMGQTLSLLGSFPTLAVQMGNLVTRKCFDQCSVLVKC